MGRSDPPLARDTVSQALRAIHYNESDAALLLRMMRSKDPAIAALPADTKAQYVALCDGIVSYRSLHAGSIRTDRPSLMQTPFSVPDPLRQSHVSQARLDRATLERITAHLAELSAKHQEASMKTVRFQMAVLDKVAHGVMPRPAILRHVDAFLKAYQPQRTTTDPHTLGIGRGPSMPQQFTEKLKQCIASFERLQQLETSVSLRHLGARREAFVDTFVKAQNAAGRCDQAAFAQHVQTLEQLASSAKRRSLERAPILMS